MKKLQLEQILTFFYCLIILVGGIIGFLKAGSLASLVMSTSFVLLLFASACYAKKNYIKGIRFILNLSFILAAFFLYRFSLSGKFMPAGLMTSLSVVLFIALFFLSKKRLRSKQSA